MPNQANTIFIGAYVNGEFNQTLTLTERGIFVDLMGIIYLKDKKKKALHINQSVYGSDYRMHSQASHIRALDDMYNINYELILRKINLYTYRNSLDSLKRLGGKV